MTPVSHRRTTRRRVLSVGEANLQGTDDTLGCTHVETIFAALGELATSPSRQPIEAVVLGATSVHRLPDLLRGVEALKRLEPNLPVIAVAPGLPLPALEGRVELQVQPPLSIDQVLALLDGKTTTPGDATVPVPQTQLATPTAASVAADARVTDTSLIDTLLNSPDAFRSALMRALAERTGETGVRLEAGAGQAQGATVHHEGVTFGHLKGGDPRRLQAWTTWTGTWLGLEQRLQRLSEEALCDQLTGALNRRGLDRYLEAAIESARQRRCEITVMAFDIDDFKAWNDRWGHDAGDVILRQTVRLLGSVIRDGDAVGRIGGDEFAVIFADRTPPRTPGSAHPDSIETVARRFQQQVAAMRFPELGLAAPGSMSISGGLATFPWDGNDAESLLRMADQRSLASKRRGKNCLTLGPDAVKLD
jgi:diguanylate cyclase (GGDEF)-like protein